MLSRACSGRFKCGPATAQKLLRSGSDAPRFESNAAVARPVRLSVCFGLEIGLQWFTNPCKPSRPPVPRQLPPPFPPFRGGRTRASLPRRSRPAAAAAAAVAAVDLAVAGTLRLLEPGGQATVARACGTRIAGHLRICRQMHVQHRRGAGLPYLTAP